MNVDAFLELIQPLSDLYGTGDPRGDLLFLISIVVIGGVALLAFLWIRTSRDAPSPRLPDRSGDGFDRFASLAGKFEKLEMNSNSARTEMMRELALLKSRVDYLENAMRTGAAGELPGDRGTVESVLPPPITTPARAPSSSPSPQESSGSNTSVESALSPSFTPAVSTGEDEDEGYEHDVLRGPPPTSQEDIRPASDTDLDKTIDMADLDPSATFKKKDEPTVEEEPSSSTDLDEQDRQPTVFLGEEELREARAKSVDESSTEPFVPPSTDAGPTVSLSSGLSKTRTGLFRRIREVFSGKPSLDEEMIEDLQAFLVSTDLGLKMVRSLTEELKEGLTRGDEVTETHLLSKLRELVVNRLKSVSESAPAFEPKRRPDGPLVIMMVGVNGVGKTTTTAKLASRWSQSGAKVLLVAADTFRAAAAEQLERWGSELGVAVHRGPEGAKPGSVVFDGMERARKEDFDIVLIDTAGRLHTKGNLMQELEGVKNVVQKNQADAPHDVVLVIDGTTGQNALQQAKEFNNSVNLTGLVVTKLDGSSKGGIVVAVQDEYDLPVRYIGVGEAAADLRDFEIEEFVSALFDEGELVEEGEQSAHGKRRRRRREEAGSTV